MRRVSIAEGRNRYDGGGRRAVKQRIIRWPDLFVEPGCEVRCAGRPRCSGPARRRLVCSMVQYELRRRSFRVGNSFVSFIHCSAIALSCLAARGSGRPASIASRC
jgi:hypothetical protein